MIMKCKPTFNFQSVEFDYNIVGEQDLPNMFKLYKKICDGLAEIAPDQPDKGKKVSTELATDGQKKIMDQYGIPYSSTTTKKEAQDLIKISIEAAQR